MLLDVGNSIPNAMSHGAGSNRLLFARAAQEHPPKQWSPQGVRTRDYATWSGFNHKREFTLHASADAPTQKGCYLLHCGLPCEPRCIRLDITDNHYELTVGDAKYKVSVATFNAAYAKATDRKFMTFFAMGENTFDEKLGEEVGVLLNLHAS